MNLTQHNCILALQSHQTREYLEHISLMFLEVSQDLFVPIFKILEKLSAHPKAITKIKELEFTKLC